MNSFVDFRSQSAVIEDIIDNLPSAIIVLTKETTIVLSNKIAELFAEKSKDDLFGMRGGEAFECIHAHEDPEGCGYSDSCHFCAVRNTVEETIESGKNMANVETDMTFENKGDRVLTISTTWLEDKKLVIVSLTDITDAREREKLLLENTKLQAAIKTGGAVCHEMNQPLTVLNGYIDMLLMDSSDPAVRDMTLTEMKGQALRLGEITKRLLHINHFKERMYLSNTILDIEQSSGQ